MKIKKMFSHRINAMFKYIKKLVKKSVSDDVPGLAAQLAFYLTLAFFPFLILIFSLLSLSPFLTEDMLYDVLNALPADTVYVVWQIISGVGGSISIIIVSGFVAMWSLSSAIGTVAKAVNRFYSVEEKRNFIFLRIKGMFYAIVAVLLVIASFTVVVFGSLIGAGIGTILPGVLKWWPLIRFGVLILCVVAIFVVIFKKMPSKELKVTYLWPGATFTALSWGVFSFLFSFYVDNFASYHVLYGGLAGLIALVTWLYMTAYIILVGGEINSILYKKYLERQTKDGSIS